MLIGLPRMHKEPGELRDFLPELVQFLAHRDAVTGIVLEEGYGAGMAYSSWQYSRLSPKVEFGSHQDCLEQDVVLVLRCPAEADLAMIRQGAVLLSMLHYTTNPSRNELLMSAGIHAVSLDSIVDDQGRRLVENMRAVGWNGMEAAFRELVRTLPGFDDPDRGPIRGTILGSGAVAGAAAFAAARYGDQDLRGRLVARGVRGVEVTMIDFDLTWDLGYLAERLSRSDILVDATRRPDPTKFIVPNHLLSELPEHAVILDLSADPYNFAISPAIVKGIEGIPQGDLDHFVFPTTDPAYDALANHVEVGARRLALSCYSWPGVHPAKCMAHYGAQLEPILDVVTCKGCDAWSLTSDHHIERALARAEVTRWTELANASR